MKFKKVLSVMAMSLCIMNTGFISADAIASEHIAYNDCLTYQKIDTENDGIYDYVRISDCAEDVISVEIPSEIDGLPVTAIWSHAFMDCVNIKEITIPDGVTFIANQAFYNCTSLKSVSIPDSITRIGYEAFYNTILYDKQTGIKYAGNWVVGIDKNVYPSADIIDGTKGIADNAFAHHRYIESVILPEGFEFIGEDAFFDCSALKSINIPDSVIAIGRHALSECINLESITIPENTYEIGEYAFSVCQNLKSINVSEDNKNYCDVDGVLYNEQMTELIHYPASREGTEYAVPDTVERICLFDVAKNLEKIILPESVKKIGMGAFCLCNSLENIVIPESVSEIEYAAFSYCEHLESVTVMNKECEIYDDYDTFSIDSVIYGYENSTAQDYAEKYNRVFVSVTELANSFLLKKEEITETECEIIDMNKDGKCNVFDYIILKRQMTNKS